MVFLFVAYFFSLAALQHQFLGWLLSIIFFIGAIGFFATTLTGHMRIVATRDEIVLYGLHKPIKYRLEDLSTFYLSEFRMLEFIVVSYKRSNSHKTLSSRKPYGTDRFIGNFYKLPLEDICEALNTRLQNFNVVQANKSARTSSNTQAPDLQNPKATPQ